MLCEKIFRWIEVKNVITGFKFGDRFIILYFVQSYDLHIHFKIAKEKATIINKNKKVIRMLKSPLAKPSPIELDSVLSELE